MGRGIAYLYTGRDAEAIDAFNHAIEVAPRFGMPRVFLAVACSNSGRIDEARASVQRFLELEPKFRVGNVDVIALGTPDKIDEIKAALRNAGLPE